MSGSSARIYRTAPTLLGCVLFAAGLVFGTSACDGDGDGDIQDTSSGESSESGGAPDPNCDALLTPQDFETVCGQALTLEATPFEGIELNPCNRDAPDNQAILLVARHSNASQASSAAEIAGGRGPSEQAELGLWASAGSAGVFSVEVKATSDAGAICSPDKLPMLLDLAVSRVLP